jgi:hypothetical protein
VLLEILGLDRTLSLVCRECEELFMSQVELPISEVSEREGDFKGLLLVEERQVAVIVCI